MSAAGPAHRGPILVTGASGFAGGHLLELLTGRHELVAWSRSTPPPELAGLARWQQVDLLDRDRVRAAVRDVRPSAVYHLAGVSQVGESFADAVNPLAGNVLGTHHLFDALRRADPAVGAKTVVHALTTEDVEVDDRGVLEDVDTRTDYDRLFGARERFRGSREPQ